MNDLEEEVAVALFANDNKYESWNDCPPEGQQIYRSDARAAIAVIRGRMMEPTEEMVEAGAEAIYGKNWNGPSDKRPGEEMKKVWRRYPRTAWPAMVRTMLGEEG